MGLACGCRYEAWFVAVGVASVLTFRRSSKLRDGLLFAFPIVLVIAAWLIINWHRSGDPFDFVHRVTRYRASEPSPPHTAFAYPRAVFAQMGLLLLAGGASLRDEAVRRSAAPVLGAVVGLLAGLVITDLAGGGPTHHVDRALVLLPWLIAPVAAATLSRFERPRGVAVAFGFGAALQLACTLVPVPRAVDRSCIEAGRALRRLAPRRYFIETDRLDFLWVEVASGLPDRAIPDRAFGSAAPPPSSEPALASSTAVAIVSSPPVLDALIRAGWHVRSIFGGWHVVERSR
jgi:hypothetical protein